MQIIQKRRLLRSEIADLKVLIKTELPFKVRIRVNRQKYASGSFNILPTNKQGFNNAQLSQINEFLTRNHLVGNGGYWQSVSYIYGLT